MALVYLSSAEYVESFTEVRDKITAIDGIISALLTQALKMAAKDGIDEYWLNDGQVQIKASYRGAFSVQKSILAFRQLKQDYINQLQGNIFRLRDSKNFRGNGIF